MENDMQAVQPKKEAPKQHHVHPFVAWMAVFNFAMIFSLAPSMILAQTTTPAMSEGSEAVAVHLPESSQLAYAKYVAAKTEGVKKLAEETKSVAKPKAKPEGSSSESPCMRACRITKSDCTRNEAGDTDGLMLCYAKAQNCVKQCAEAKTETKTQVNADLKSAYQTYLDAVKAAGAKREATVKQAKADFEADVKKAKADLEAAKAAIKASGTTDSSSASS